MEWITSRLPWRRGWGVVFSARSRTLFAAVPEEQQGIIRASERSVYGAQTVAEYEAGEPSQLRRMAKRALAQQLCRRALIGDWKVNAARWVLFAGAACFAAVTLLLQTWKRRVRAPGQAVDTVVFYWAERLHKFVRPGTFGGDSVILHRTADAHLGWGEIKFALRTLWACPRMLLHPELVSNLVRWVSYYGYVVHAYRPRRRVVHFFEGTSSSSLMTAYLNERGIGHVNVQHGEHFATADFAFSCFNEFWLWGEHYKEVFAAVRCPEAALQVRGNAFHRELFQGRCLQQPRPQRILIIDPFLYDAETVYFESFLRVLTLLRGWEVRVRRHPMEQRTHLGWAEECNRHRELLESGIKVVEERPETIEINDALRRTRVVMGVSSAAMVEAWIMGCKVLHIPGGPDVRTVMAKYGNSRNALYLDESTPESKLREFLSTPAILDDDEERNVARVSLLHEVQVLV